MKKSNKWLSSDLHLFHDNIIDPQWSDNYRPFKSIEEHNEYILEKHNSVVGPNDTWYCLGDVFLPGRRQETGDVDFDILNKFNGSKKILILGNHDTDWRIKNVLNKYFDTILSSTTIAGVIIVTHIPVHTSQLETRFIGSIHGHTHCNNIYLPDGELDKRYVNVSMEAIDYTPVNLTDIKMKIPYDN